MWYTNARMKNPWIIIGIIALVLFGGAFWYASISAEQNNEGVEIISHTKGNPEAVITLTEYSDLQCPACAAFLPAVNQAIELYGDSIKFEYKHFPLPIHPHAIDAAMAAEAAGQQGKFFEYHDVLFANQQNWSTAGAPRALFLGYAEELGLDMDLFRRHLNASVLRDEVNSQFAEGRALGITGTPTFFLNGERMQIETYQDFIEQIGVAVDPSSADADTDGEAGSSTVDSEIKFGL